MFSSHFYSSLFLTAALASCQQLLIGVIVCFLFSHMVTVCGFLKPLLLHFLGSREGRALSWPVVLPVSGVTPPSQHPAPSPWAQERWPQSCHCPKSHYGAIYQYQGMLRPVGPPERLGHLAEDTQLLRDRSRPPAFGLWA